MLARVKEPPCKTEFGCAKGSYEDPIEIGERGRMLISLFETVRVGGIAVLNDRERTDRLLWYAFARLDAYYRSRDIRQQAAGVAIALAPFIVGGAKRV